MIFPIQIGTARICPLHTHWLAADTVARILHTHLLAATDSVSVATKAPGGVIAGPADVESAERPQRREFVEDQSDSAPT